MKKNISLSFSDRSTQITSSSSNKTLSTLSMKKSRISLKCSQIENALMIKEYDDVYKSECHDNIDNEINLYTELANIEVNLLCNFDDNKIFILISSSQNSIEFLNIILGIMWQNSFINWKYFSLS